MSQHSLPVPSSLVSLYVEEKHKNLCATPSDIFEHLPVLAELASKYRVVVEAGVRTCVSTWSLSHGLLNLRLWPANGKDDKGFDEKVYLISLDLQSHPNIEQAKVILGSEPRINFRFVVGSDLSYTPEQMVGLFFIDTLHCGEQIFLELCHFARWLQEDGVFALHDTEVDKLQGEPVRCRFNIEAMMRTTGYTREGLVEGMESGIKRFLASPIGQDFEIKRHYPNCNGLTIIGRKSKATDKS